VTDIIVRKDIIWRVFCDEYACVRVERITRIVDEEGDASEKSHLRIVDPHDDISEYNARLRTIITAARYPEAVARYDARLAGQVAAAEQYAPPA
jgi:hypothetical protein